MNRDEPPRPTDAELEILRVLWERGEATVRDVHDVIGKGRDTGYTTVLKTLQIMTDKGGSVRRDESHRSHVYRASRTEEQTQRQLVGSCWSRALRRIDRKKLVVYRRSLRRARRRRSLPRFAG